MKTENSPSPGESKQKNSFNDRFKNEKAWVDEPPPNHQIDDPPDLIPPSKLDEELRDVVSKVPPSKPETVRPPGTDQANKDQGKDTPTNGGSRKPSPAAPAAPQAQAPIEKPAPQPANGEPRHDGPPINPIAQQTAPEAFVQANQSAVAPDSPQTPEPQPSANPLATAPPRQEPWQSHQSEIPLQRQSPRKLSPLAKGMIWLAGADDDKLALCPKWELRKYEAFGATVLVPSTFGAIAASYAVSTVTPEGYGWAAYAFAAIWGLIILTIDRALLSSYRAFASPFTKLTQFVLRFTVAILMGFAIAHPLTLLLFKDTIAAEVDKARDTEIEEVRSTFAENKAKLEARIIAANETFQRFDEQRQAALNAPFEDSAASTNVEQPGSVSTAKVAMEEQVEQATTAKRAQLANLDAQLEKHNSDLAKVREDYSKWQEEYDAEISGNRGGPAGIGPRAKSIEADQLAWRRTETARLTELVTSLTKQRTQISEDILQVEQEIRSRYANTAAAEAESIRADEMKIASLERDLRSQRLAIFQSQQEGLADQYKAQMDSAKMERDRLMAEDEQLAKLQSERIEKISKGTREDLLTQTLVLHKLFEKGEEGGHFAMIVYGMIAGLFMLIDTIPLVVKFFTKSSVYDRLIEEEEKWHGKPIGAKEISDEVELARIRAESRRETDKLHMETERERKRLVNEHNQELLRSNQTNWKQLLNEQVTVSVEDVEKVKEHNRLLFQLAQEDRNNTRQLLEEHSQAGTPFPSQSPPPTTELPQLAEKSAIAEPTVDSQETVEIETDGRAYDGAIGDEGLDQIVHQSEEAQSAEPTRENRIGEKEDRAHGSEVPE